MIYVEEQLSENKYITPEGYLYLIGVCIARVGEMTYKTGEIAVPSKNGIIKVSRTAEDLFDTKTLASCNLKPFTLEHPVDDLDSANCTEYLEGVVTNPRPDENNKLLLADILVYDKRIVDKILNKEVLGISLGYDCDYTSLELGVAIQTNIRLNHVSLVRNPRGGSICSIRDSVKDSNDELINLYIALSKLEKYIT